MQHFHVHVDFDCFKKLYAAQFGPHLRNMSLLLSIILVPMAIVFIAGGVGEGGAIVQGNVAYIVITVLFTALAAFTVFQVIRPSFNLHALRRRYESGRWFERHGMDGTTAQEAPLYDLSCDYDVEVGEYGFVERTSDGVFVTPWLAMTGKSKRTKDAVIFTYDQVNSCPAIYEALHAEWAFMDDEIGSVLVIPREVADADPQLVASIHAWIARTRSWFKEKAKQGAIDLSDPEIAGISELVTKQKLPETIRFEPASEEA
jgi:hypothetical protein